MVLRAGMTSGPAPEAPQQNKRDRRPEAETTGTRTRQLSLALNYHHHWHQKAHTGSSVNKQRLLDLRTHLSAHIFTGHM